MTMHPKYVFCVTVSDTMLAKQSTMVNKMATVSIVRNLSLAMGML